MKKIKSLKGKTIAIVGMGKSWFDYNLAKSHGVHFDEVWSINGVASVIYHESMSKLLKEHQGPIYTCELDDRCPGLVEYPIKEVITETNCYYLNNTVAYAIAFAYWNEVSNIKLFGIDFSYQGNLHFAEAGRGCVEFWLSKCIEKEIQVEVASTSGLLDTNVPAEQKLYGYHRLADPLVIIQSKDELKISKVSELEITKKYPQHTLIDRTDNHLLSPEPKKW